jgi:hypothetical protein
MRAMVTAMATTWAMATATRLAGTKEGKAKGGKGDGEVYSQPDLHCPGPVKKGQKKNKTKFMSTSIMAQLLSMTPSIIHLYVCKHHLANLNLT